MGWAWASLITSASDLSHTTSIWSTWQTQQGGTWALPFPSPTWGMEEGQWDGHCQSPGVEGDFCP